jgi:LysR family glycine cleavage system transcriptional activator
MRRLPPLKSLPDFAAAGRHLSFTKAAAELGVTHGAVSRQIKALEDYLGAPLFRRLTRRIELTEQGRAYLPVVERLLDELTRETDRLRELGSGRRLTVSTGVSFAMKWLAPRLPRFQAAHPGIEFHLDVSDVVPDLERGFADAAVFHGLGRFPGLVAERVFDELLLPVCAPALLKRGPALRHPADLLRHTLLHEDRMAPDWPRWLAAHGVTGVDAGRGPRFSHGSLLLEAAVRGEGIALGRSLLMADDLAAGRLVKPLGDLALPAERGFDLVYPAGALQRPAVAAFREWLLRERG